MRRRSPRRGPPPSTPPSPAGPRAKLCHLGALSRFDGRPPVGPADPQGVLVLTGFGGHDLDAAQISAAAAATPEYRWDVLGVRPGAEPGPGNLRGHPPDADVWGLLGRSGVVVASASGNAVAETAAARRPLICLPQQRPFGEQAQQARVLADAGLAVAVDSWPDAGDWPALLERARHAPDHWSRLHDGRAGERLVALLERVAAHGRQVPAERLRDAA